MKLSPLAKINLSLRVLGRREDGFHELETLMACIRLEDSLELEVIKEGSGIDLECNDATIPCDNSNLVVVATSAYLKAANLHAAVRLILRKHIPSGAGLGGGSSDAASVLLGLNALYDQRISGPELAVLAAKIGSDVPFFLGQGSAAWCRGRGETFEPIELFDFDRTVLLIKPPFPVETKWAYTYWKDARKVPGLPYDPQPSLWGDIFNDLEVPVFEKFPILGLIKRWLLARPEVDVALMSGSGSTVFAILRHDAASESESLKCAIQSAFGDQLWVWVCQTLSKTD